jgi:hypothetical protein
LQQRRDVPSRKSFVLKLASHAPGPSRCSALGLLCRSDRLTSVGGSFVQALANLRYDVDGERVNSYVADHGNVAACHVGCVCEPVGLCHADAVDV